MLHLIDNKKLILDTSIVSLIITLHIYNYIYVYKGAVVKVPQVPFLLAGTPEVVQGWRSLDDRLPC